MAQRTSSNATSTSGSVSTTVLSARDTKLTAGSPYWPIHSQSDNSCPTLEGDATCDVSVIGGGITGALVSYHLAKNGLDTILLEKNTLASGSTSASTALISYEFDEFLTSLSERYGAAKATRAYRLCFEAVESLGGLVTAIEDPCDYDRKVSIRLSNTTADLETFQAEEKVRTCEGMPTRILTKDELMDEFELSAQLGFVSDNAAQIDPFKLAHRLIRSSARAGMRAFEKTKVTRYEAARSGVILAASNGATVKAKHVVFATGYESEKYLPAKLATLRTDYCLVTPPLRNMEKLKKCHIVEHQSNYLYASTFGDRIMVGIESGSFQSPGERRKRTTRMVKETLERIGSYAPFHSFSADYHWAATFAQSKDSLPYIVQTEQFPRAWFVLGYGGNGIASSAMLARIVIDLVCGRSNPNASLFSPDR